MTEPTPHSSPGLGEAQEPCGEDCFPPAPDGTGGAFDPLEALIADAVNDFSPGEDLGDDSPAAGRYSDESGAIANLARQIVLQALREGATDIHLESFEKRFTLRYRVDGMLHSRASLPLKLRRALLARFKVMARLDPADDSGPKDGRLKVRLSKFREATFQVSSMPTFFGESMVLRTFDQPAPALDMAGLGLSPWALEAVTEGIHRPSGLIVVTGPAGSGKTLTLYSCLAARNTDDVKILTVEYPVTISLPGLNQVDIARAGLTVADAFKAFAQQDLDICLIGEIRDPETARLAVETALAGRLVFSTLHTADTPSAITRLLDLGVPPASLAEALTLIVAQRLVRRICPHCKAPLPPVSTETLFEAGFAPGEMENITLHQGRGCPRCQGSGYHGRTGLFEVMTVTPSLAEAIAGRLPEARLRIIAWREGLRPLRHDGLLKILQGLTTLEQVLAKTPPPPDQSLPYVLDTQAEDHQFGADGGGPERPPVAGLTGSEEALRCIVGHQIGGQTLSGPTGGLIADSIEAGEDEPAGEPAAGPDGNGDPPAQSAAGDGEEPEPPAEGRPGEDEPPAKPAGGGRVIARPLTEVFHAEARIDPAVAPKASPLQIARP